MRSTMKQKLLCLLLAGLIPLVSAAAFSSAAETGAPAHEGFELYAETDALQLYYNKTADGIGVLDKTGGAWWSSVTDKEKYGMEKLSPMLKSNLDSLLGIVYTDVKSNEGKLNKVYSSLEKKDVTTSRIPGGIAIHYNFTLLSMKIDLEITVDNDCLVLRIPADKITEKTRNLLMALELLPCFGAAGHADEGYILYPDGCGSLLRYENYNNRPNNLTTLSWNVYGPETTSIGNFYTYAGDSSLSADPGGNTASLPLFGLKKNDAAYLAYVTEGAADTSINVSPEGHILPVNRAAFEFRYRNTFDIILSNISAGQDTSNIKKGTKVDKTISGQSFEVRYQFLHGQDADYSGMANRYRGYLLDSGRLNTVCGPRTPLALDLFCGITEQRLLFDKFIAMTTFENAQEILQQFLDSEVFDIQASLKGWSAGGYGRFPITWPVERRLGGLNGLDRLAGFAKTNGLTLFTQANAMLAAAENGKFSQRTDVVYLGNSLPFSNFANTRFLLNSKSTAKKIADLLNRLWIPTGIGASLEGLGRFTFPDYSGGIYRSRTDTVMQWETVLSDVKKSERELTVEGGNEYVLKYADRLYDIPTESSDTNINDEEVPFYQMIVHGHIPYSSDAGNLFYDETYQKLQWIEFGCMPYYELTYRHANELKYTDYKGLYSSYYQYWTDKAAAVYGEFNTELKGIWDSEMVRHERLSENLVCVTYGNGIRVFINYGDEDAVAEGVTVPARGYKAT